MPAVTERQKRNLRITRRSKALRSYIRDLMTDAKRTQAECAEILEITQPAFSRALNGMTFSVPQLIAILDYLGADREEFASIIVK